MAKQTTFATPWVPHKGEARQCLSCGTVFAFDLCPTCALLARVKRLIDSAAG